MKYCKNCGKELSDNARFCDKCGKPVEQEIQKIPEKKKRNGIVVLITILSILAILAIAFLLIIVFSKKEPEIQESQDTTITETSSTETLSSPTTKTTGNRGATASTKVTTATSTTTTTTTISTTKSAEDYISNCVELDCDEVARYPDKYKGDQITITGIVLQVVEEGNSLTLRVAQDGDYDKVWLVLYRMKKDEPRILEDDTVTLYGNCQGTYTYETVLGASVTAPYLYAEYAVDVNAIAAEEANQMPLPVIDEQVIYDANNVKITALKFSREVDGFRLSLLIENNTSKNITVYSEAFSVNDVMVTNDDFDGISCDVVAGKKANTYLDITSELLYHYDLDALRYVNLLLTAYDSDNYKTLFTTEQTQIKAQGVDDISSRINGITVYENNGLVVEGIGVRDDGGYLFGIYNETGEYITFDVENISINDFSDSNTYFDLFDEIIFDGCQYLAIFYPDDEFMKDSNIDEIESIEFNLNIRPRGEFDGRYKTGRISLIPD